MRISKRFSIAGIDALYPKTVAWAQKFDEVVWLDSNNYPQKHGSFNAILAVAAFTSIKTDFHNGFDKLSEFQNIANDWIFGYLTYDLKNDTEKLHSSNFDGLHFPDIYFFQPQKIILFFDNEIEMIYLNMVADEMDIDWKEIQSIIETVKSDSNTKSLNIFPRTTKQAYLDKVSIMLQHINRGDIYEANLCMEFFAEFANINPLQIFQQLNEISKAPFSTFLKLDKFVALSASPERYLKKTGTHILSQPIKGTAKRMQNAAEDLLLAENLRADAKERSENIMITDLVRNDLSRIAKKGSVQVDELCQLYTFKQVHQLITTISCEVDATANPVDIIKKTFPMGSMTGAPKISAMQLIETLEDTKRGLYSGSIGYFTPNGDFDFNVVIRSILYNTATKYVSFSVGSAITSQSVPENEYEECLLKANAMRQALENNV